MKAGEKNDHEIIGLRFKQSADTSSMLTKSEQDETMCNSSTDESSESIGSSILSIASVNLSGLSSVIGNKGSPDAVCSDSESMYSIEDEEEWEKSIDDESWYTDIGSASDGESDETKLESFCPSKNIEGPIICSDNDILMQREGKREDKTRSQNLVVGENPLLLNSYEKTDLSNNKSSNQFDSNEFQTNPSPSNSSSKPEETSPQDACKSSSESPSLVPSSNEIIQSNLDKQMGEKQNETPDTTITASTKNDAFRSKSLPSRITTGLHLESLKNKVETLSLIYNKLKNEVTQRFSLQNISASKLSESLDSSPTHSTLPESIRTGSTQLENQNTASGETNESRFLFTAHNHKGEGKKAFEPQTPKKIKLACAFSEKDNSRTNLCKSYHEKKEISINSCLQLPKNECSISRDTSFQSQMDEFSDQGLVMNEKRHGLGVSVQEASIDTVIQHQEIENSEILNKNCDSNIHTSVSYTSSNYDSTSVVCCHHCRSTSNDANHGKIIERGTVISTVTTAETGNKPLTDSEIPSIDIVLQLFNTDNTLAKNILLAVSSEELRNKATYTNIVKYLRQKKLLGSKLLLDVKAFLRSAEEAHILKMKGKRYILAEGMGFSKPQHTGESKNKRGRIVLEKKILRQRVIAKGKNIQYNAGVKRVPKKLSRVPKTKSRKF